jgi:ubiquinone/menaquinone biosynthesis C-methylase UbiE
MNHEREQYTMGYGPISTAMMAGRTAQKHAAFLLPHLKPGMKVLDCGCGPGSLTLGLAEVVAPGEGVGTDLEEAQLEFGRKAAQQREIANVRFQAASIYELPFDNDTFDAIFISAVLGNLQEPLRGLGEAHRVLKTGGVIGVKEFDHGGDLLYPADTELVRGVGLYHRLRMQNGHDPESGRKLLGQLQQTGFRDVAASATYETFFGAQVLQQVGGAFAMLVNEAFAESFVLNGWATADEVNSMAKAWLEFAQQPGAFYAAAWCEAVAWK